MNMKQFGVFFLSGLLKDSHMHCEMFYSLCFYSRFVMHKYKDQIKESGAKTSSCFGEVEYRRANGDQYLPKV
jgi:hypothetical protein